jgi:hypothetical protein
METGGWRAAISSCLIVEKLKTETEKTLARSGVGDGVFSFSFDGMIDLDDFSISFLTLNIPSQPLQILLSTGLQ